MSLIYVEEESGKMFRVCPETYHALESPWRPTGRIPGARYMTYALWAKRRGLSASHPQTSVARHRGQRVDADKFHRRGLRD